MKTAFQAALKEPWAITPEVLAIILAIAAGEQEIPEAIRPQALQTKPGQELSESGRLTLRDNVAVLSITGPIFPRANLFTEISGATSLQTLAQDLGAAVRNPGVDAIILEIDSPGGALPGVEDFAAEVRAAAKIKPLAAFVYHQAASAAYWIASAADQIVMPQTANVGSVGVILGVRKPDDPEKSSSVEFVSSVSPRKRINAMTDAGREELQAFVDKLGVIFVSSVAAYRGVEPAKITAAGGGLLIGEDAIAAGFADRIGTFESLLSELSTKARGKGFAAETRAQSENEEMKLSEKFRAALSALFGGSPAATVDGLEPEEKAVVEEAEKALKAERAARIKAQARAFADGLLLGRQALPFQAEAVADQYEQAAMDDLQNPVAEGRKSRVEVLKETFAGIKAHALTAEAVPAPDTKAKALPADREAVDPYAELEQQERAAARAGNPKR